MREIFGMGIILLRITTGMKEHLGEGAEALTSDRFVARKGRLVVVFWYLHMVKVKTAQISKILLAVESYVTVDKMELAAGLMRERTRTRGSLKQRTPAVGLVPKNRVRFDENYSTFVLWSLL
jgi:hypothetical protein